MYITAIRLLQVDSHYTRNLRTCGRAGGSLSYLFITRGSEQRGCKKFRNIAITTLSVLSQLSATNTESVKNKRMHNEQNNAARKMVRAGNGKQ